MTSLKILIRVLRIIIGILYKWLTEMNGLISPGIRMIGNRVLMHLLIRSRINKVEISSILITSSSKNSICI